VNRDSADAPLPPPLDEILEPTSEMSTGEVPSSPTDAGSRPLCVITLSSGIDRVEVKLWRTLLMTIGGNHPPIVPLQVVEVVATSFNIDASSMAIMAAAP
jgi:hypothetical protein